jgi:hypothetical protein
MAQIEKVDILIKKNTGLISVNVKCPYGQIHLYK